jgi:hypothetical protein
MARKVRDEGTTDSGCDPFMGKKLHYIEQVTRVLAIHRGDQLPP